MTRPDLSPTRHCADAGSDRARSRRPGSKRRRRAARLRTSGTSTRPNRESECGSSGAGELLRQWSCPRGAPVRAGAPIRSGTPPTATIERSAEIVLAPTRRRRRATRPRSSAPSTTPTASSCGSSIRDGRRAKPAPASTADPQRAGSAMRSPPSRRSTRSAPATSRPSTSPSRPSPPAKSCGTRGRGSTGCSPSSPR